MRQRKTNPIPIPIAAGILASILILLLASSRSGSPISPATPLLAALAQTTPAPVLPPLLPTNTPLDYVPVLAAPTSESTPEPTAEPILLTPTPTPVVVQALQPLLVYSVPIFTAANRIGQIKQGGKIILSGISSDASAYYFFYYDRPAWISTDPASIVLLSGEFTALSIIDVSPTPPPSGLEFAFSNVPGIIHLSLISAEGNPPNVYLEATVAPGANTEATAAALHRAALRTLANAFLDFSCILDDGTTAISYTWSNVTDSFTITPLSSFNATRAAPTSTPLVSSAAGCSPCPKSCPTAVAMNCAAAAAALCPGLDRDHDGVACYGD